MAGIMFSITIINLLFRSEGWEYDILQVTTDQSMQTIHFFFLICIVKYLINNVWLQVVTYNLQI